MIKLFKEDLVKAVESEEDYGDVAGDEMWRTIFQAVRTVELANSMTLEKCSAFLWDDAGWTASRCKGFRHRIKDLLEGRSMSADEQFTFCSDFCHKLGAERRAGTGPASTASCMAVVKLLDNEGSKDSGLMKMEHPRSGFEIDN